MRIDYKKLVVLLTPTFLRRPRLLSVLRVLVQPLAKLSEKRLNMQANILFGLHHTGQVCHLKNALNHHFGITDYTNGFQIEDASSSGDWEMAYDETELLTQQQWVITDQVSTIIYGENTIFSTVNFIVYVPLGIYNNQNSLSQVKRIVEQCRLVSRSVQYKLKK